MFNMNNFFLTFLSSYITISTACLIFDIFIPSVRIHRDSLENTVKHYKHVTPNVLVNLFINSLPLYLFLEVYYFNYESSRGIFVKYLQLLLSLFMGLVIHLLSTKMFQSNMFQKYVTDDNSIQYGFGWQTYYLHPLELYLVYLLPPILIPVMFSFSQGIIIALINISNIVYVIRNSSLVYSTSINYFIYDFEKFLNLSIKAPVQNFQVVDHNGETYEESTNETTNDDKSESNDKTNNEKNNETNNETDESVTNTEKQINIEGTNVSENLHLD